MEKNTKKKNGCLPPALSTGSESFRTFVGRKPTWRGFRGWREPLEKSPARALPGAGLWKVYRRGHEAHGWYCESGRRQADYAAAARTATRHIARKNRAYRHGMPVPVCRWSVDGTQKHE